MSDQYLIRYARTSDLDRMTDLLSQLFSFEQDFVVDPAKQRHGLSLLLESDNAEAFVVEASGRVIAMTTMQIVVSMAEGGSVAWIEDVVVDESHRGRGVGEILLNYLQTWAGNRQILRLQLVADRHNQPALDFYQKNGWFETNLKVLRYR